MDHNRAVGFVVSAGVGQVETLGQVVVHLNGTQLPLTTDRVLNHKVEFRAVECSLAILNNGVQTLLLRSVDNCLLGLLPVLVRTDILLLVIGVAQRYLSGVVVELQGLKDIENDVDNLLELLQQLVGAHEHMSIVLGETTYTSQTVQLATLLVAIYGTELSQTQGQILVRTGLGLVDLAVVGAVHRFEQILLALDGGVDRLERVLTILSIVTRSYIELLVTDVRGDNLLVAISLLHTAQELLQAVAQSGTLRQPQRQTLTYALREREQLQLLAELTVVALLSLLHHHQILIEHRLLGERDTIYTGQHLTLLVAAPVSACNRGQFDSLDKSCVGQVRTAAEVGERAIGVERNCTVLQCLDQLHFVLVALLGECAQSLSLSYFGAYDSLLGASQLGHLLLDTWQVALGDGHGAINVVVETVLDCGTDTELNAGVECLQSLCQQVRRGVPECVLTLIIVPFEQFDVAVIIDRQVQVANLAINLSSQHLLCQTLADALGDLHRRSPFGILTNAAVGESDFHHCFVVCFFVVSFPHAALPQLRDGIHGGRCYNNSKFTIHNVG